MPVSESASSKRLFRGCPWQASAGALCVLLGLAMVANNQMAGEAMWYWYAVLFHQGVRLYADLHIAVQPLYILELNLWIRCFGHTTLATESISILHILMLCAGIFLLLRHARWPDWQKAVVFAGIFVFWVSGDSYRFDDYHVTTESFMLYSVAALLAMRRLRSPRGALYVSILLGILDALITTTRLNDGVALFFAIAICILALVPRKKALLTGVFALTSVLGVLLIIRSTGDSYSDWLACSLFRAIGSKGGAHSVLLDPFLLLVNGFREFRGGKWICLCVLALLVAGFLLQLYRKASIRFIIAAQLGLSVILYASLARDRQAKVLSGFLIQYSVPVSLFVTSTAAVLVALAFIKPRMLGICGHIDRRWTLLLIPLAIWASIATSAAARPLAGYYPQIGMALLLFVILIPVEQLPNWIRASFVTWAALILLTGTVAKIRKPYSWNSEPQPAMFRQRVWFSHPVYGPMYMDKGLLDLSRSVCQDIGTGSSTELLSLPFSYSNYFCDTPPWHGYVETFFDTTARSTIEKLMRELQTSPPQWIVYQRQMESLTAQEAAFLGHGTFAQRDLDTLLMSRIASGQWTLVDTRYYGPGEGWYIIRTR